MRTDRSLWGLWSHVVEGCGVVREDSRCEFSFFLYTIAASRLVRWDDRVGRSRWTAASAVERSTTGQPELGA